jgi:hypothetical protein
MSLMVVDANDDKDDDDDDDDGGYMTLPLIFVVPDFELPCDLADFELPRDLVDRRFLL